MGPKLPRVLGSGQRLMHFSPFTENGGEGEGRLGAGAAAEAEAAVEAAAALQI